MFFPATSLGFGSGGGKATVSLTDNTISTSDLTTYTFSSQALGTPETNRRIVVGVVAAGTNADATVSTLTIGGISATQIIGATNNGVSAIWLATVPTGTTGDVVVVHSAGRSMTGIGVYRVIGARATATATASNADDPMATSLEIPSNGVAIGIAGDGNNGLYAWTNLTEDYDEEIEASNHQTGASREVVGTTTPTITCDPANAAAEQMMVLASFAPI